MKVAVSVPDPVFQAAEKAAGRLRVSRSRLYSLALEAYVGPHGGGKEITKRLNALYGGKKRRAIKPDPTVEEMALEVLRSERW